MNWVDCVLLNPALFILPLKIFQITYKAPFQPISYVPHCEEVNDIQAVGINTSFDFYKYFCVLSRPERTGERAFVITRTFYHYESTTL